MEGMYTWTLQLKDECDAPLYTSGMGRVSFRACRCKNMKLLVYCASTYWLKSPLVSR